MFYIHQASCISPQHTFAPVNLESLLTPVNNQLRVIEPDVIPLPGNVLRRMGRGVRMSVIAGMPLLKEQSSPQGIIIGTANAGMQESGKFLDQIIEYDEDTLSPANFVQSTSNSVAAQISMMFGLHCYANTHVHGGLAFENALLDAAMLVSEQPEGTFLLGGADEITNYNYSIDQLAGWYKAEQIDPGDFYAPTPGTIAGEGAALFNISGKADGAKARLVAAEMLNTADETKVAERLAAFLQKHLSGKQPSLLLSGENGDIRSLKCYNTCEGVLVENVPVARFKHLCGEYPTASAFALWLAVALASGEVTAPAHLMKRGELSAAPDSILVYNSYKNYQHSFMLMEKA
ncbi:beta-ketoacyl synthase-like protein [Mucilaginibacter yixingensis]|uniref:Beta-ketoacyl synthase-like protein n=1 Tax=Mucilaginibacter yixingensis TaxID=1295612 RepID=A0A2T5JDD1_9SPHI|nr:beta-ketoacyl synthase chain length factor [Mucilaginibacter yixingensis]PTQ99675.1 beta-ketoacyl synthase-like protein [Mucilaginibacter yixingensis]